MRLAIFSIRVALLTWYGSSVTTICILPERFIGSMAAVAPDDYLAAAGLVCVLGCPSDPMMVAPVGKSGP